MDWGNAEAPHRLPDAAGLWAESWASNPREDGRIAHFTHAEVEVFEGAGHWVHHDRLEAFLARARAFLSAEQVVTRAGRDDGISLSRDQS